MENLWDGIMKNPELMKGFISSKFVGECLQVPAKLLSMMLHVASGKIMFSKPKSKQVIHHAKSIVI